MQGSRCQVSSTLTSALRCAAVVSQPRRPNLGQSWETWKFDIFRKLHFPLDLRLWQRTNMGAVSRFPSGALSLYNFFTQTCLRTQAGEQSCACELIGQFPSISCCWAPIWSWLLSRNPQRHLAQRESLGYSRRVCVVANSELWKVFFGASLLQVVGKCSFSGTMFKWSTSFLFSYLFRGFVLFQTLAPRQSDVSMVVPSSRCRLPWDPALLGASSAIELHVKAQKERRAGCSAICFLPLSCLAFASVPHGCVDALTGGFTADMWHFHPPYFFNQRNFDFNL